MDIYTYIYIWIYIHIYIYIYIYIYKCIYTGEQVYNTIILFIACRGLSMVNDAQGGCL